MRRLTLILAITNGACLGQILGEASAVNAGNLAGSYQTNYGVAPGTWFGRLPGELPAGHRTRRSVGEGDGGQFHSRLLAAFHAGRPRHRPTALGDASGRRDSNLDARPASRHHQDSRDSSCPGAAGTQPIRAGTRVRLPRQPEPDHPVRFGSVRRERHASRYRTRSGERSPAPPATPRPSSSRWSRRWVPVHPQVSTKSSSAATSGSSSGSWAVLTSVVAAATERRISIVPPRMVNTGDVRMALARSRSKKN